MFITVCTLHWCCFTMHLPLCHFTLYCVCLFLSTGKFRIKCSTREWLYKSNDHKDDIDSSEWTLVMLIFYALKYFADNLSDIWSDWSLERQLLKWCFLNLEDFKWNQYVQLIQLGAQNSLKNIHAWHVLRVRVTLVWFFVFSPSLGLRWVIFSPAYLGN